MKSLLIVGGKLPRLSTLALQLGLVDIFGLRLGAKEYREILGDRLNEVKLDYEFLWLEDTDFSVGHRVYELVDLLTKVRPKWRSYRNIILYPAQAYVTDGKEAVNLLRKLALTDTPIQVQGGVIALPSALLAQDRVQDRFISELEDQLRLKVASDILDLSQVQDLFRYSRTGTEARAFNEFKEQGPYLVKRSTHVEKLRNEYTLLSTVPAEVRPYFPSVGAARDTKGGFEYEVEFIPRFDVGRIFIHGALDASTFQTLLEKIDEYLKLCPKKTVAPDEYAAVMREMFIAKLKKRSEDLAATKDGQSTIAFIDSLLPIGWQGFVKELTEALETALAQNRGTEVGFAHGDLCFSNMLFDAHSGFLKFIDPRGGRPEHLPVLYDIAKLSHSALGGYDLICNGLAKLEVQRDLKMTLNFKTSTKDLAVLREPFIAWLKSHGWDPHFVRLCEASLFMSLLPLHIERPSRVVMQALAGWQAYQESSGSHE